MEKFIPVELSRDNTNPTNISMVYLEFAKYFCHGMRFDSNFFVDEFITEKIISLDADGDKLNDELVVLADRFIEGNETKIEKEKLRELILICFIKIPIEFSIQAIQAESNNQIHLAWTYVLDASYWIGMLKAREIFQGGQGALSANGLKGAITRLASCPKQLALKEIKVHYEANKHQFKRRGFTAQFIREMHDKYPEITAIKTIENLVAALNKDNELIPR